MLNPCPAKHHIREKIKIQIAPNNKDRSFPYHKNLLKNSPVEVNFPGAR